ncbi:hypothetical protein A2890_03040 [candidate division WWE3 bacterium RIFCSPLOWO2_01_FULL_53_14]|uniref:Peptidase S9 prolyl oligopeptidase catalytic domain-containing protein n=1 Tax=candidate division WWE3 bacterium RIFCSPLOWO2_01_FULL_53_14 TaxID=1802628 RepID=A0A1F4VVK0_UNCKA|nr:MAG: hypothetical protein A2890_03040 [candidate division WWE3 bacterium RIFCSPLOWO2_01_FULL_53_14]
MTPKFEINVRGQENKRVVFLLAGWGIPIWIHWPPAKFLSDHGFCCITYAYDYDVCSADPKETVPFLTSVRDDILHRIRQLKREGHRDFSVFGSSLGSVVALMVANSSPDVSRIVLNTAGADPAEILWTSRWHKLSKLKERLEKEGMTLGRLRELWAPVDPINNIDHLDGKHLLVCLSKPDHVISYSLGEELVRELKRIGSDCRVTVNEHLGHVETAAYNLLKIDSYLPFLKGEYDQFDNGLKDH